MDEWLLFIFTFAAEQSPAQDLTFIYALLGAMVILIGSALIYMSLSRKEAHTATKLVADANKQLVETRDVEVADLVEELEKRAKNTKH